MKEDSSWGVVSQNSDQSGELDVDLSNKDKTSSSLVEELISEISQELKKAHEIKYDIAEADSTAALCLRAQKELAEFLSEAELLAKERKSNLESIEGERYLYFKFNHTIDGKEVKLSDEGVKHLVAKDPLVKEAKHELYEAESDFSKWKNLFGMLKDSHIYFRGLAKGKSDWS